MYEISELVQFFKSFNQSLRIFAWLTGDMKCTKRNHLVNTVINDINHADFVIPNTNSS